VPEHSRDIAELAALVVSDLTSVGPEEGGGSLIVFVWRDCAMTIKFPSGRRMYAHSRDVHTLDSMVHEAAIGITEYCRSAGIAVPEIRVHKVPPEAKTREQISAWFEAIPDISMTVYPLEEIGFDGPVPPPGEVG
jgi:hypothetical protein